MRVGEEVFLLSPPQNVQGWLCAIFSVSKMVISCEGGEEVCLLSPSQNVQRVVCYFFWFLNVDFL